MNQTAGVFASFKRMEHDGWQQRAPHYHDRLGKVTGAPQVRCSMQSTRVTSAKDGHSRFDDASLMELEMPRSRE
jgi:hypothetical protein